MGNRFDDLPEPLAASSPPPSPTPALDAVAAVVRSIEHPYGMRPRDIRDALVVQLRAAGWTCRTRVKVDSRGTLDGYRGVLDLVAHPPARLGSDRLADPVLVEFDALSIEHRTLAKLQRYDGQTAGVVVVLVRACGHPPVAGVDTLICLG